MVQSKVTTELGKTEKKMKSMESQLKEIGHILTPEDLIEYLEQYDDMEIKNSMHQMPKLLHITTEHWKSESELVI